jgi:hypothetical protein
MTPKNETPAKTNEEMLRAIIAAQVKGGYGMYSPYLHNDFIISTTQHLVAHENFEQKDFIPNHILEILLDTEGCKAAYPNPNQDWSGQGSNHMHKVSHAILSAWHSGFGNNINAAIKTAFDLLPPSR